MSKANGRTGPLPTLTLDKVGGGHDVSATLDGIFFGSKGRTRSKRPSAAKEIRMGTWLDPSAAKIDSTAAAAAAAAARRRRPNLAS